MIAQQKSHLKTNWRATALLQTLVLGSGTFYQLCERAGVSIEDDKERYARNVLDSLICAGRVYTNGLIYALSVRVPAANSGQVATSHHRGTYYCAPVRIVRAAAALACAAALSACNPSEITKSNFGIEKHITMSADELCYHGVVYVNFKQGASSWGGALLDADGKVVLCEVAK